MPESFFKRLAKSEIARFILSAGSGFLTDACVFFIGYHYLFVSKTYHILGFVVGNYVLSLTLSYTLGVTVNFLMTRYLVFADSKLAARKQFFRFALVAFIGFFANVGVLKLLVQYAQLYPPVARILAALGLFIASFFVHKLFSFNLSLRHHARTHHKPGN